MLRAALALAKRNMPVFPCKIRGKEPAIHNGVKGATTDHNVIKGWWGVDNFNIGLATGTPSGVFVLDIDGEDGDDNLRKLEAESGSLPNTVEVLTARGRHLYFKMPDAPIKFG